MKSSAIKENKVFRRLYHRGKSKAGASLVTYCMKNRRGETRVGITTSKKIGTAVERNRARRDSCRLFTVGGRCDRMGSGVRGAQPHHQSEDAGGPGGYGKTVDGLRGVIA